MSTPEEQNVETFKKMSEYLRQIASQLGKIAKSTGTPVGLRPCEPEVVVDPKTGDKGPPSLEERRLRDP